MKADPRDTSVVPKPYRFAEAELELVDILVNNVTGWIADTFTRDGEHVTGLGSEGVSASTHNQVCSVDARAGALLSAECARRHISRRAIWDRNFGLSSGGPMGFPAQVTYGADKVALENQAMSAAFEPARFEVTVNIVYPPVTDTGWVNDAVREHVSNEDDLIHIVELEELAESSAFLASDYSRLITANIVHLR